MTCIILRPFIKDCSFKRGLGKALGKYKYDFKYLSQVF